MAWEWVAPAVTGTVGLVTISGTIWMAHKTLRIQVDRAMKNERRAIYARFLKAMHEMEDCYRRLSSRGSPARQDAVAKAMSEARASATAALAEITIIGNPEIETAATEYLHAVLRTNEGAHNSEAAKFQTTMITEMRRDVT